MRKSFFKRLLLRLTKRSKHISKTKGFSRLADNPAGSKLRKWAANEVGHRGVDGIIKSWALRR